MKTIIEKYALNGLPYSILHEEKTGEFFALPLFGGEIIPIMNKKTLAKIKKRVNK